MPAASGLRPIDSIAFEPIIPIATAGPIAPTAITIAFANVVAFEKKFFHWFLEFPEVFQQGGFDCILGNPPYAMDGAIAVHHPIKELEKEEEEVNQKLNQFNSMFTLVNGAPEAIVLCVAAAALMTAPHLFHI